MKSVVLVGLLLASPPTRVPAAGQLVWVAQAPGPSTKGQVENIANGEVAGAVNAVAAHPTDANVAYIGAVNGGIWKTSNAMAASPVWSPQTDQHSSLSIGALAFDPTDSTARTLVAGAGGFSSFGSDARLTGLLRTTDGGTTWTPVPAGGSFDGLSISAVAPRGATIVVATVLSPSSTKNGVWRSTDGGNKFELVSGAAASGLPAGPARDLAADPSDPNRLFTNAGTKGIYRSNDAGATWQKTSNAAMDQVLVSASSVRIAAGAQSTVYAAMIQSRRLAAVFRSPDGGATWAAMGLPRTSEGGIHPGGQGNLHMSIAADPADARFVYVGGDRQPTMTVAGGEVFPNSIGARDYSGRLFRGDASKAVAAQWVHLTHSNQLGASGGGTASGSAPHADSRNMVFAANGVLIEVDDGGVYRRTNPRTNAGDWFSMNGNLQATEFHSVAWDALSNVVIGGAQDTGTPGQRAKANLKWESISTGDGGCVAVDASSPAVSVRYSSYQYLYNFRRQVYDAKNALVSETYPALDAGGGVKITPHFYTPIRLNAVTPTRLVFGGVNGVFESLDQGDTVTQLTPAVRVNASGNQVLAYGADDNPDVLYVGVGSGVYVRTAASAPLSRSTAYSGGTVAGIALDPHIAAVAHVSDAARVFRTIDGGGAWTEITGNLQTLKPGTLRTIAYATSDPAGALVVGSDRGVFIARGPSFSQWASLGSGLPSVPVYQIEYSRPDGVLLAGTLGRGAWTLPLGTGGNPPPAAPGGGAPLQPPPGPVPPPQTGQPEVGAGTFELHPGIIVDRARQRVYVMDPGSAVNAVDLATGSNVWSTKAAAKPLAVSGPRLVAQAEATGAGNALTVVMIDPATGQRLISRQQALPAGVRPGISETLNGQFSATAVPSGGEAIVAWEFVDRPTRGVRPGADDSPLRTEPAPVAPGPASPPADSPAPRRGAFRLNVMTGATTPAAAGSIGPLVNKSFVLPVDERVPAQPVTQFLSADGRHFLVSARTADDRVFAKYTLTVFDRATRARVGEFRSHVSQVPFFIFDGRIAFVTPPFSRLEPSGQVVPQPLKIRIVDLATGQELWSREVRDIRYRGPVPG